MSVVILTDEQARIVRGALMEAGLDADQRGRHDEAARIHAAYDLLLTPEMRDRAEGMRTRLRSRATDSPGRGDPRR